MAFVLLQGDSVWSEPEAAAVRDFLAEVRETTNLPVILALTKDDRIVGEINNAHLLDADGLRQAEIELRERMMTRVRRSLDFDGVHLHYSTSNEIPSSRKARRRLLRYIESLVEAGSREESGKLLDSIASKDYAKLGR